MDMNSFFRRRHEARAERSDTLQESRDTWTIERSNQIVEALAGMSSTGRPGVYPSLLQVKVNGSATVGGRTEVSVFEEFGWWLAENSDLLTAANTRDFCTNPVRTDIKLFRKFADHQAEFEAGCKSDEFFDDGGPDWEAA